MILNTEYHKPVMASECLDALAVKPNGTYVDCTLGGGGHFRMIASLLSSDGVAIGIDRDGASHSWLQKHPVVSKGRIIIAKSLFSQFDMLLQDNGIDEINGVLMDLGVSSHQLDDGSRGFSYQQEADLDMRMDKKRGKTAAQILNTYNEGFLADILANYGEVRNSPRMAKHICTWQGKQIIKTTTDLITCLENEYGSPLRYKMLSKVFQALRIEVNNELTELDNTLKIGADKLVVGGRMVVMAYHSLEDRIVKTFFRTMESSCECPVSQQLCSCSKTQMLKRINRKVIKPSEDEIRGNSRARSARLRIAEKV